MKKIFGATALSLIAGMVFSVSGVSAQTIQVGVVQGLISDSSSAPLNAASVSVTCNGQTLNTVTDGSGFYFVQYPNGVCKDGMTATVTATKGGLSGTNSGVLTDQGTIGLLNLDVAIVHVLAVPEFGLMTGLTALLGSAGSFAWLRRKMA